jgi:WD40 repeat protein
MDNNIAAVRLALTVVLAVTLISLELDLACSLENKVGPADILLKQEALQNAPTFVTPLTVNASDSIAYVFSDMGDYILDNNSVLSYNGSEILRTDLARHGNFTDSEASTNITAASLSKYLAGNVPLNRNLDVIDGNGTNLSYYNLANYSFEERLLLIYSLFDYLSKKEDNKNSQLLYANGSDHLINVVFSPDNETIALSSTALSGADNTIRLLDLQTKKELFNLTNCSTYGKMAFRPDGRMLASGTDGSIIRISDWKTGKELKNISQNGSVELLAFSPEGNVLASTGNLVRDTWIPMLWDIDNNTVIGGNLNAYRSAKIKSEGHNDEITDMAFNPNGQTLATSSYDNTTKIWSAKDGTQLFNLIHDGPVLGLAYSPDGEMLATASEDRTARIWDAKIGTELFRLNHSGPVQAIAFDPKPFGELGWVIVTVSSGNLTYWQASTGDAMGEIGFENSMFNNVVFSPTGIVAASSEDNLVRLFSEDLFTQLSTLNPNGTVESTAFSPNGAKLAIVCDKSLLIWDIISFYNATQDTVNDTISILINASNSSTLNGTQYGWQGMQYFISSNDPAILLSAFCEKLGIDARIIAGYGVTSKVENISSTLSSDKLHLYAEAYLGTHNSQERNDVLGVVDQIKKRYNISDVYSHINLSTNDVWLNLDVASPYPGGPFNASPKQMQVYISSLNNQSNKSINETNIKANETPSNVVDFVPSIVNENVTASLEELDRIYSSEEYSRAPSNFDSNVGKGYYEAVPYRTSGFPQEDISVENPRSGIQSIISSVVAKDPNKGANSVEEVDPRSLVPPNRISIAYDKSDQLKMNSEINKADNSATNKKTQPSSSSDGDDGYWRKTREESTPAETEVAVEPEVEAAPAAEAMGGDIDSKATIEYILKLMGLIAGGFIVIIATGYRGREPPMDDDDFDDIVSFKRNIENKRSGK